MKAKFKDLVIAATTKPSDSGVVYEVVGEAVAVGRDEENGIVIPRRDYKDSRSEGFARILGTVSRKHCVLYQRDEGLYVKDAGSRNRTYIGRKRWLFPGRCMKKVTDWKQTRLIDGDWLILGDYGLEVSLQE